MCQARETFDLLAYLASILTTELLWFTHTMLVLLCAFAYAILSVWNAFPCCRHPLQFKSYSSPKKLPQPQLPWQPP